VGLLSPLGGVIADRMDRKKIMILADGAVGVISLALGIVVLIGEVNIPLLLLVLAVRSAAQAFHAPAMTALTPFMVPENALLRVNSLSQLLVSLSSIGGPVLGIFLYTALGFAAVLFLDALCATIACACLIVVVVPTGESATATSNTARNRTATVTPNKPRKPLGVWASLLEGLRFLAGDRGLLKLLILCTGAMILFMPLGSLYPLMTYDWFGGDGYQASLVEAVYGVGLVVGSALLLIWGGGKRLVPIVLVAGVVIGVAVMACGLLNPHQFIGFVVLTGIMAMGTGAFNAPILPMMQKRIPQAMMGRVTSLFITVSTLVSPVGLLIAGFGAEAASLTGWFFFSGLLLCALQLFAAFSKDIRALDKAQANNNGQGATDNARGEEANETDETALAKNMTTPLP
jgi:DHA3 family macrolide efflux protein-like MFS transporter